MTVAIPLSIACDIAGTLRATGCEARLLIALENAIESAEATCSQRDDQAAEIYEAYPRKAARPAAIRAIKSAIKKVGFQVLLDHVNHYRSFHSAMAIEMQYTPMPATWFNQERWNDTPTVFGTGDSLVQKKSLHTLRDKIRNSKAFIDGPYYVSYATDLDKMQLKTWKEELLKLNPNEDFDLLRK